jgi:hypothetical protein
VQPASRRLVGHVDEHPARLGQRAHGHQPDAEQVSEQRGTFKSVLTSRVCEKIVQNVAQTLCWQN